MIDQDKFNKAVINWISEATGLLQYRSDGGRRILADACGKCWSAFEATNHDAAPASKAPTDASPLRPAQGVTAGMGTGDICKRLRAEIVWESEVGELMEDAATEIERLRIRRHERDAIAAAAESVKLDDDSNWTTLIELLERTT